MTSNFHYIIQGTMARTPSRPQDEKRSLTRLFQPRTVYLEDVLLALVGITSAASLSDFIISL